MTVHTVTTEMMRITPLDINLDKWGVDKLFQTSDELIIRYLKFYFEDKEKFNINNKNQLWRIMFLEKYYSLALCHKQMYVRFLFCSYLKITYMYILKTTIKFLKNPQSTPFLPLHL